MPITDRLFLLTPPGASAIAVLRLIGPGVDGFLRDHFSRPVPLGRCVHGTLAAGDFVIDDPVIVRCAPDVIDINLHGGPWVVRSAIQAALAAGFCESETRFPLPAEVVDQPSEIWREVLEYLPLALTEQAARMLLAQPAAWDDLLGRAASGICQPGEMQRVLTDRSAHWMLNPPTVAIIGPPNVGKSTLANQLFAQQRSIVADLPGTTRDWVGEMATLDGLAIMLVDTPGVRATDDPVERAAISSSREKIRSADLVLIVLDQSSPMGTTGREMIDSFPKALVIANKSDRPHAWEAATLGAIPTVAVENIGIAEVRSAVRNRFDCEPLELSRARCWTDRQRQILTAGNVV